MPLTTADPRGTERPLRGPDCSRRSLTSSARHRSISPSRNCGASGALASKLRLLDSSAWIAALRPGGPGEAVAVLREWIHRKQVATTPPVIAEILQGARDEHEYRQLSQRLRALPQLACTRPVWSRAWESSFRLRRRGLTFPLMDILIASVAVEHGVTLVHADGDFEQIKKVMGLRTVHVATLGTPDDQP